MGQKLTYRCVHYHLYTPLLTSFIKNPISLNFRPPILPFPLDLFLLIASSCQPPTSLWHSLFITLIFFYLFFPIWNKLNQQYSLKFRAAIDPSKWQQWYREKCSSVLARWWKRCQSSIANRILLQPWSYKGTFSCFLLLFCLMVFILLYYIRQD